MGPPSFRARVFKLSLPLPAYRALLADVQFAAPAKGNEKGGIEDTFAIAIDRVPGRGETIGICVKRERKCFNSLLKLLPRASVTKIVRKTSRLACPRLSYFDRVDALLIDELGYILLDPEVIDLLL